MEVRVVTPMVVYLCMTGELYHCRDGTSDPSFAVLSRGFG